MAPVEGDSELGTICSVVSSPDRLFGFAIFRREQRSLWICEYSEDTHVSRTEALLLQVQPRSCCAMLYEDADVKKLNRLAESCGVDFVQLKAKDFKFTDIEQDLLRLLNSTEGCGLGRHLEEQRQKQGMRALSALISHCQLLSEPANFASCTLGLYPIRNFMYLDKAAFSALNLLPRPDESIRASTTVFGFLNRCRTAMGTRRLRQWLTQPLCDAAQISERHDVVEAFCSTESLLREVESHLRHIPDLNAISCRLHRVGTKSPWAKATLEDMVQLYQCIRSAGDTAKSLETYSGERCGVVSSSLVQPLRSCLADFNNYRALVEQTIDLKQADTRNYCINSAFDVSLQQLASQRDHIKDTMEKERQRVEAELNLGGGGGRNSDKLVSLAECPEGFALRVTKKFQATVQNFGKGKYKTMSIKKQEFLFTTTHLQQLNQQLLEANERYAQQSQQLIAKAVAVTATYRPVVDRLADVISRIDVLAAFARVALSSPCQLVRARIDPTGKCCEIEGATHVLVVANSDKGFIANDLKMDSEESRLHLITGPNMGGKSTYIRSVALIALLNQVGCYVPCARATLPVFDAIMCRVGASDMQLRGISTFMAEMLEAACILNVGTNRTLVIVDELGRGTSTSDGFGLAWAIAKHLVEKTRCFTLFATHFHELAALQSAVPGVRNRHATAAMDPATGKLTFLYALADGAADQSYGGHCAELAGFPEHVVKDARKRAAEFEAGSCFGSARKTSRNTDGMADIWTAKKFEGLLAAETEDDFVRMALAASAA